MISLTKLTSLSDSYLDLMIEEWAQNLHQLRTERRRRSERTKVQAIINCEDCIGKVKYLCPKHDTVNVQPRH